jgi:peptidoglycan/xylan/chitin deacetylase (PgdA/CDA1 family)
MIKNFLFHRVYPDRDPLWDPMDVKLFEKCIRTIRNKYQVRLLEDLVLDGALPGRKGNFASIVFDDGYKDNIEFALPILHKYNVKASFYVVTDCIEFNVPTWTYILDYRFQHTNKRDIDLTYDFLPDALKTKGLNSRGERIHYVQRLKPFLKALGHEQRSLALHTVKETFDDVEVPLLMMNWHDLKELKNDGHYVGSHTVTHSMLGTMQNEENLRSELVNSGKKIEEKLGYFPKTISYPVGSYNEMTKRMSREAGYEIGLAVNQIPYDKQRHDRFEVPRIELYNESWLKTRIRIGSLYYRTRKLFRQP